MLECECGSKWRNEINGGTGRTHWCRRKEICAETDRRLKISVEEILIAEIELELKQGK